MKKRLLIASGIIIVIVIAVVIAWISIGFPKVFTRWPNFRTTRCPVKDVPANIAV